MEDFWHKRDFIMKAVEAQLEFRSLEFKVRG